MTPISSTQAVPPGQTVAYMRVSTTDQNLDRQRMVIESAGPVHRWFSDEVSGAKGAVRPGLEDMLGHVRAGDTVRVVSLDRLARSLVDLERIVGALMDKGVVVEFLDNHMRFVPGEDDKYANFQRQVLASVAELERAIIRERQREGIAAAKARGGVYKGRKRSLTPDDAAQARRRHATGESMVKLAADYKCSRRVMYDVIHRKGVYMAPPAPVVERDGAESVPLPIEDAAEPPGRAPRRAAKAGQAESKVKQ